MSQLEPTRTRTRILVVDDSALMRKAASKMLGEEFDVLVAKDGVEGWETLQGDTSIQVLFTDLEMPHMDGFELLSKVRGADDDGTLKMPVIIVTGVENDEAARRKALDMGATDFITKPFGSVDLLARARAHANYRRITQHLEQQVTLDALTGLANRSGFLQRLQQDLSYARRHGTPLSIVRIDIDGFRDLFLRHGKAVAEVLVAWVATQLQEGRRKEDSVGRIGLASFALSLPAGEFDGSLALLDRLRERVAAGGEGAPAVPVSISAVLASPATAGEVEAEDVLEALEGQLRKLMAAGRNQVVGIGSDGEPVPAVCERGQARPADAARAEPVETITVVAPMPEPEPAVAPAMPAEPITPVAVKPPEPAPVPAAAPSAPVEIGVDEAIALIASGSSDAAARQLPQLIRRMLPLFRLMSPRQRAQLVAFLQKLGV